jgi:hypothetical protein
MIMIWNYYHLKYIYIECTSNYDIFKKSHLFKNDDEKDMSCTWTIINIDYNKLQKQLFQNSFIWKKNWEKYIHSYF